MGVEDVGEGRRDGLVFRASGEEAVAALSLALAESGAQVLELTPRQATLEDLFFELTEDGSGPAEAATRAPNPTGAPA
jgi:hypothetical protein